MDEHPGGRHLINKNIGKDATTAFFGGVYDHSNAAHNVCAFNPPVLFLVFLPADGLTNQLLAMMRVGVLRGGLELESEKAIPPSQRLEIMRGQALAQLRAEASKSSVRHPLERVDSDIGQWRDVRGLPSPPMSTGALNSDDEVSSGCAEDRECQGLNLSRK